MSNAAKLYISKAPRWRPEMEMLRQIARDCGLDEELKWNKPCYTLDGKNIVIIQDFKAYCALMFFKGVLVKDPAGILVKTGENTEVGRQARYTSVEQIVAQEQELKACIMDAIDVEKKGVELPAVEKKVPDLPPEFQDALQSDPDLESAFRKLTPGRQKAYIYYFSQAKQPATRLSRIERYRAKILEGKGLND